jgi:fluoride ion exporter CrcB/FEX
MIDNLLFYPILAASGGLAALVRAAITKWTGLLPWGLLIVNTVAAGLVGAMLSGPELNAQTHTILLVGVAGGLSTFAGVSKAAFDFWHRGRIIQTVLTLSLNLALPLMVMGIVINLASL